MSHRQKKVNLKIGKVLIDKKIAPLIKWIDSFKSVKTYASCQGTEKKSKEYYDYPYGCPYVFFEANTRDIVRICKMLPIWYYDEHIVLECGYNPVIPRALPELKYTLRFIRALEFKNVIKKLEDKQGKYEYPKRNCPHGIK